MFVSKCNEKKSNYIQQANVKFCADGIRSRQKIDDIQTTVEQPKQKLTGQYSCEFTTETSINLVKGNVRYLLGEYDKSPKSPETLDNNLSELETVINIFDVCVRKILKEKDADVEICADVVRSRPNVSELQTIIETVEQKRYNQLLKSVPAVTPLYFVKENEQNLVDYHVKSFKSNEK
ncbi:Hypothetical predicted protein [Mytilus galloprovincialis]|uniref:Uncharacterized protein n=1 Tax=Mytilus galloprovincialis TaxID=29158 RepID=A0A8B6D2F0_MYTGA|nr:Hypothetical predicted protein [Mytilus galloprovincialis]